jgi:hypothetical protein
LALTVEGDPTPTDTTGGDVTYQRRDHAVPPPSAKSASVSAREVEAAVLADLVMDEVNTPTKKVGRWKRFTRKLTRKRPPAALPASEPKDDALASTKASLRAARRARSKFNRFSPVPESLSTLASLGDELVELWPHIKGDALTEYRVSSLLGKDLQDTLKAFEGRSGADTELAGQLEILVKGARTLLAEVIDGRDANKRYLEGKYIPEA